GVPRDFGRGRWDELHPSRVTALRVQLGLVSPDGEDGEGRRGRSQAGQPVSNENALPLGFGTTERNGLNGARISRRGKLAGGRPAKGGAVNQSFPSDPYGTR